MDQRFALVHPRPMHHGVGLHAGCSPAAGRAGRSVGRRSHRPIGRRPRASAPPCNRSSGSRAEACLPSASIRSGARQLHPEPELPTIYHSAEFGAASPLQIYRDAPLGRPQPAARIDARRRPGLLEFQLVPERRAVLHSFDLRVGLWRAIEPGLDQLSRRPRGRGVCPASLGASAASTTAPRRAV